MRNLVYKEFSLSVNKIYLLVPILTGALLLIPQWLYFIAMMYFFFITVPNLMSSYNAYNDNMFSATLPVRRKDILTARIITFMTLELLNIITGVIFAVIHIRLYHNTNFGLDLNMAFFGASLIMFAVFNLFFFPGYYKTAYFFGIPLTIALIAAVVFAAAVEFLVMFNRSAALMLEGGGESQRIFQASVLAAGIIIFIVSGIITRSLSIKNFEKADI